MGVALLVEDLSISWSPANQPTAAMAIRIAASPSMPLAKEPTMAANTQPSTPRTIRVQANSFNVVPPGPRPPSQKGFPGQLAHSAHSADTRGGLTHFLNLHHLNLPPGRSPCGPGPAAMRRLTTISRHRQSASDQLVAYSDQLSREVRSGSEVQFLWGDSQMRRAAGRSPRAWALINDLEIEVPELFSFPADQTTCLKVRVGCR